MLSLSTLLKRGFTPNVKDFNNFLLFLSRSERFKTIIYIFSQLSSNKINADAQTRAIFAKSLLKEHKYEEAYEFLKTLAGKSSLFHKIRIFDSLIQRLCIFNKDPEKGFCLLKDLLKTDAIFPSSRTFCLLIHSFSSVRKMDRVIELLELISDDKFKYLFDNYVCSSVISGFVRIGEPKFAVGFYENALKSGFLKPNTVTCTVVVTAYCKLRNIDKISDLVAWMGNNKLGFDVVFYSNWIYGCFGEGLIEEAFQKVRAMVDRKVELDTISYSIFIDGFSKNGNVEKAVGFLYHMKKKGVEPNLVTYTAIILGFCNKGKLNEAFQIFDMLKKIGIDADEFTYAILIHGVCRIGDFDRVFELLDEMETKGINPGIVTYNTVINGLCKFGRTSEADNFSGGIIGDAITYSTLLHGYVQEHNVSGILETKKRLEAAEIRMDVVMCNTLIKALLMVGLFEDAFVIYKGLQESNLLPKPITYYTLIDGYCKAGRIDEALEIFDEFRNASISSPACYNSIISGLCKNGMLAMAIDILKEYIVKGLHLDRTVHTSMCYYSILRALLFAGMSLWARFILTSFIKTSDMSEIRVNEMLLHYLCLNDVKRALVYLSTINERKWSITIPVNVFETLINNGSVLDAYELLMGAKCFLPFMNVIDYSIMIDALCKGMHVDKALNIAYFAKKKGIALNIVTYNSIINGLCRLGCMIEAFRLFDSLEKIGVVPSEITYGTLIDALVKERFLNDARVLFEKMFLKNLKPTTRIYNSLINGYCKSGLLEEAIKLYQDLEVKYLDPDGFTVSTLVNGYCQKGDMEGALKLFFEFKSKSLVPDFLGFMYLIKGLCSKGRMEESRSILRYMLQTKSVIDLLVRVDTGNESESLENLLVVLCERGSINEAVAVLDEVGSMFFSYGRNFSYSVLDQHDFVSSSSDVDKLKNMLKICDGEDGDGEKAKLKDFDSLWIVMNSLCQEGDLAKANRLTKLVMDS